MRETLNGAPLGVSRGLGWTRGLDSRREGKLSGYERWTGNRLAHFCCGALGGGENLGPFVLAALFIAVGVSWFFKIRKETWDEERHRLRIGATVCLVIGAMLVCVGMVLFLF